MTATASFVNSELIAFLNDSAGNPTTFFKDDATGNYISNGINSVHCTDSSVCTATLSHSSYDTVTIVPLRTGTCTITASSSTYKMSNRLFVEVLPKETSGTPFLSPYSSRYVTKITLGSNVASINSGFHGCYNLKFVDGTSSSIVPTVTGDMFTNCSPIIYSPCGLYNDWKTTYGWVAKSGGIFGTCQGDYGKLWYSTNDEIDPLEEPESAWTEFTMTKAEWEQAQVPDEKYYFDYFVLGDNVINRNMVRKISIGSEPTKIEGEFLNDTLILKDVTIPSTITQIGDYFLWGGVNSEKEVHITLPNTITHIPKYFLEINDYYNTAITIPNSVTSIDDCFMCYLSSYNSTLTLSNTLATIGDEFMFQCSDFDQPLVIPNSVTSIGQSFMSDGENFVGPLSVPSGVTFPVDSTDEPSLACYYDDSPQGEYGIALVGEGVDEWIAQFPDLDPEEDDWCRHLYDARYTTIKYTLTSSYLAPTLNLYAPAATTVSLDWGDGTTETWTLTQGDNAKSHTYSSAGTYTLEIEPHGNVYLGSDTSYGVISPYAYHALITEASIGAYVTKLNDSAFFDCTALTSVDMSRAVQVTEFGEMCFLNAGFSTFTFPIKITTLGDSAFSGSSLTIADIPNTVTSIGESCFSGCPSLTDIILSDNITAIPGAMCDMCPNLDNVTCQKYSAYSGVLPNITSIGYGAFSVCPKMYVLEFPNTLQTIDCDAFASFGTSTGAYLQFSTMDHIPTITGDACEYGRGGVFHNLGTNSGGIICVPSSLKTAWLSAQYWSNYTNNIQSGSGCGVV